MRTMACEAASRWWKWSCQSVALLVVTTLACGGDSGPTDPAPPVNAPPVIQSVATGSPQVDGDQTILLTATVTDAETALAQLTYTWSASPDNGTFTGSGSQVRWKPSSTLPESSTISLTVIESYISGSTAMQHTVTASTMVRYNDLVVAGLAHQFLLDFANLSVSPTQCLRNFSDTLCSTGKAEELKDITDNRNRPGIQIESALLGTTSVALTNGAGTAASSSTPCIFTDRLSNGTTGKVGGSCDITAVFDQSRWWLCESHFSDQFCQTPPTSGFAACPSTLASFQPVPFASHHRSPPPPRFSHP